MRARVGYPSSMSMHYTYRGCPQEAIRLRRGGYYLGGYVPGLAGGPLCAGSCGLSVISANAVHIPGLSAGGNSSPTRSLSPERMPSDVYNLRFTTHTCNAGLSRPLSDGIGITSQICSGKVRRPGECAASWRLTCRRRGWRCG